MAATKKKKKDNMTGMIQAAIKILGLTEPEYRDIYEVTTGERSLGNMSPKQRWQVIEAMKARGFKPSSGIPGDAPLCHTAQAELVRHHWLTLHRYHEVRNPAETAMLDYVKRITGISRMEWLKPPQMVKVIETMKKWRERVENRLIAEAISKGFLPPKPTEFADTMDMFRKQHIWMGECSEFLSNYNTLNDATRSIQVVQVPATATACANGHG